MAATASRRRTRTSRAATCRQHALRAAPSSRPRVAPAIQRVVPGHLGCDHLHRRRMASGATDAGGDPVNGSDPTGMYSYQHYWTLGEVGSAVSVFDYMKTHMMQVFPFSTGGCERAYLKEKCDFHPLPFNNDHLHVQILTSTSFTLEVDNWCQFSFFGLACIAGDPPGSTIKFSVGQGLMTIDGTPMCEDVLSEIAKSPGSGFLSNLFAPAASTFLWHQQAVNLSTALGGSAAQVFQITWQNGVPSRWRDGVPPSF
jgi:hypothetical protein